MIIAEVQKYTNPLDADANETLYNIVNGRVAIENVNVYNCLSIGERMSAEFRNELPQNFYKPIKKEVVTMETLKKKVKIGSETAYDTEKLYARLLVVSQSRHISLPEIFSNELTSVPTALFDKRLLKPFQR